MRVLKMFTILIRRVFNLKSQNRLWIYSVIIIAGLAIFCLYSYFGHKYWGLSYPRDSFLFMWGDRFMDFFNVNKMSSGLDPYITGGSSYPPLAIVIAYLVGLFIPGTPVLAAAEIRNQGPFGKYVLVGMYVVCILLISVFAWRRIWKQARKAEEKAPVRVSLSKPRRVLRMVPRILLLAAVTLGIALTAPMIFAIDRGNYLIICTLFIALFCIFYGKNDYAASVFLALAACLKIFPIVLFYLFFRQRKWKPLFVGVGTGAALTVGSTLLFKGGFFENLMSFAKNLMNFSGGIDPYFSDLYLNAIGTRSFLASISIMFRGHISDKLHIVTLTTVVNILLLIFVIILCLLEKRPWRQILYLSFFMVLFPNPSYCYNLAYLTGPILLFLLKEEKERFDWLFLTGLALLMIPKSYYYFNARFVNGERLMGLNCLIDPLIMLILLGFSFVELLFLLKKRKSGRLRPQDSHPEAI